LFKDKGLKRHLENIIIPGRKHAQYSSNFVISTGERSKGWNFPEIEVYAIFLFVTSVLKVVESQL
jgi:hypothetical protein